MRLKKPWQIIALLIAAFAAVGTGCFLLGRSTASSYYQAEQELNIQLNRSELDGLGDYESPIYVTGHSNPDSDTVCSSIAYAHLLRLLGYDARPVVLGSINRETEFILDTAGLDVPELLEDASGCTMVLVDHSDYTQSVDGLEDASIISIIDHHGLGAITTGNPLIYDARPLGSSATIIWMRYRNYGLEPDRQTALAMLGAIISDTVNLKSGTTTFADREAVKALSKMAGFSDIEAFAQELYRASISYDGMTDEEIFFSDYKEYETAGKRYSIGAIKVYDETDAQDMVERMKALIPSTLASTGMDMTFAQISILHDDLNITYIVPSDDTASEVIETAFGDMAVFDGTAYVFIPGISRKKELVPGIVDVLEAYPKE